MKCPKCQNEIMNNAKFCTKCGCNLAEAMASVHPIQPPVQQPVCTKCGADLKPGARFCVKCGTPIGMPESVPTQKPEEKTVLLYGNDQNNNNNQAVPTGNENSQAVPMGNESSQAVPTGNESSQAVNTVDENSQTVNTMNESSQAVNALNNNNYAMNAINGNSQAVNTDGNNNHAMPAGNYNNYAMNAGSNNSYVNTAGNQYGNIVNTPNQSNPQNNNTVPNDIVPPEKKNTKKKKESKSAKAAQGQKKSSAGLVIAAVILAVLVVASGVVCFLVWNGTVSLPAMGGLTVSKDIDEQENEDDTEEDLESSDDEDVSEVDVDIDVDELFAETDALAAEAGNQINVDAEIINGMDGLTAAIDQFVSKAEEAGDASLASDRVADAYTSYVTAVNRHKDMLNASTLSGAIYAQIMIEMNDAISLGDELIAKGYTIDTSSLISAKDDFDKEYREKIINTFDEFTTREAWSRTEAWNLMKDTADNMFDTADLDDPIRLRYVYALSWWTQRQIETELNDGTITAKGAAIKIGNLIEAMDYNPMMINYYINYMDEAGEDCSEVADAYNEVVEHINNTQGIQIGSDIDLAHFWYFNDFGTYSIDSVNGVTQENRQWIRDRMSSVTFIK